MRVILVVLGFSALLTLDDLGGPLFVLLRGTHG